MTTPSAPPMKTCVTCSKNIVDYCTNDFIQFIKKNYPDIKECQELILNYKRNPNLELNKCKICLLSKLQELQNQYNKKKKPIQGREYIKNYLNFKNMVLIIIILLVPIYISSSWYFSVGENGENRLISLSDDKLKSTITSLKDQFPLQLNILKKMGGALSRLKSPGEPFIFLFLYDDTNKKTTDCLVTFTSIAAKQNIFTNTTKILWMNAFDWIHYSDHDPDLLNKKLIAPLKENEVLVLENLQDLPWSLAKSFHYLCDSVNPEIAKAMYIFELRVDGIGVQNLTEQEKLKAAERAMTTAWANATNSFRAALITRLTSYVDTVLLKSNQECHTSLQSEESFIRISP